MKKADNIERVKGDGGSESVSESELTVLKNEMDSICRDAAYDVNIRRSEADDTRFCRWNHQHSDGLKHDDPAEGHKAFPFDGSSDARVRLTDMIVNEREKVLVAAATRAQVAVKGMESMDMEFGARLAVVLKWVLQNQLGSEYRRELKKIAQWQEGDVPAGALMGVYWNEEVALENVTLDVQGVAMLLAQALQGDPSAEGMTEEVFMQELQSIIINETDEDRLTSLILRAAPHLRRKRIKRMIKELREAGSTVYPSPYTKTSVPKVTAHRLFEDVFFPANTADIQRARAVFVREWLTEAELQERVVSHGYSQAYVDEVLGHEKETGFPMYTNDQIDGSWGTERVVGPSSHEYRGLYEQITAYHKSVNDDGVPGIYYTCFHHAVDFAAKERELLNYAHGRYPFVWFGRETLTARLWDSRSVPELGMGHQKMLKVLWDSFLDHTQLTTIPPITVPRSRPNQKIELGPMKQIKENRPGEISFMEPPRYPAGNEKAQPLLEKQINEYFGRPGEDVPPVITQLHSQDMVDSFLSNLKEGLHMILQLVQQYMSDEVLARVTGAAEGIPVARSREEIQGKFDIELSFDAKDLDMDYVMKKAEIIGKWILPIDTLSTIQRDKLVARLFSGIDPSLAAETLTPVQAANMKEILEEQDNFAKIAAGVEPPMFADGQNHALRQQVIQEIAAKNPAAIERLSDDSRGILDARLKHLQHQIAQEENKQIGRLGAAPALGG